MITTTKSLTLQNVTNWTGSYVRKIGNVCELYLSFYGTFKKGETVIATIPEGFTPTNRLQFYGCGLPFSTLNTIVIEPNGRISVYANGGAITTTCYCLLNTTYIR